MLRTETHKYRFLFAGGGTGGHLFPAVAVAEKIKAFKPEAEILFVGSKSKIEGKVIPQLGYKFKSIWIKGFTRRFTIENILFPVKVGFSMLQSLSINMKFKPKVAIGSGGYAAGPAIWSASVMGAKVILLEQNSFPGITTRMLEKKADEIHISFEDSKKYFKNKEKVFATGNPVRESLKNINREEAAKEFGFSKDKKTLLVLGGSLGAGTLNEAVSFSLDKLNDVQIIWQTGKNYFDKYSHLKSAQVWINPFIEKMDAAYSAADLVIARAGATTIAEITSLGLAVILVPSPNVSANHQYYNAKSLSDKNAAILIEDKNIKNEFISVVTGLINDDAKLNGLKKNSLSLGRPDAAEKIAKRAIKFAEEI